MNPEEKNPPSALVENKQKYEDFYLRIRRRIFRWMEQKRLCRDDRKGWTGRFVEYLVLLPDLVHLLIRLLLDRELPVKYRTLIVVAFGYLISPIDVIPDFIPVLGLIDDLLVVVIFLNRIMNSDYPPAVEKIQYHWAGEGDVLQKIKEIFTLLNDYAAQIPRGILKFMRK